MVRAGGAGERAVGDAGRGGDAAAGGVHEDRADQRAGVVRRREAGVLRVVLHSLRDRIHPLPLRGDPAVAGHQEPGQRQPRPHLQELQPPPQRGRLSRRHLQPAQLRPHSRGQGEGDCQRAAGDAGVPGFRDPAQHHGQGPLREPAAAHLRPLAQHHHPDPRQLGGHLRRRRPPCASLSLSSLSLLSLSLSLSLSSLSRSHSHSPLSLSLSLSLCLALSPLSLTHLSSLHGVRARMTQFVVRNPPRGHPVQTRAGGEREGGRRPSPVAVAPPASPCNTNHFASSHLRVREHACVILLQAKFWSTPPLFLRSRVRQPGERAHILS